MHVSEQVYGFMELLFSSRSFCNLFKILSTFSPNRLQQFDLLSQPCLFLVKNPRFSSRALTNELIWNELWGWHRSDGCALSLHRHTRFTFKPSQRWQQWRAGRRGGKRCNRRSPARPTGAVVIRSLSTVGLMRVLDALLWVFMSGNCRPDFGLCNHPQLWFVPP